MSNPQAALNYLSSKGFEFQRVRGEVIQSTGEVVIKRCPYCDNDRYNFSINVKKDGHPFQCWACEEQGNLLLLKKYLGDGDIELPSDPQPIKAKFKVATATEGLAKAKEPPKKVYQPDWIDAAHRDLLANKHDALVALKARGLNDETIAHFKVGVVTEVNGSPTSDPAWAFPYYTSDGIALVKYRSVPPAEKRLYREKDMESVLFNEAHIDPEAESIILCEGEVDAMSVWQSGHRNVVSVSTGAKAFRPEWIDFMEPFDRIILLFDADDAGQKGAKEIAQRLGVERISTIVLPEGKDANDILSEEGDEALSNYVKQAQHVPIDGVEHISQTLEDLQASLLLGERIYGGLKWMFPSLTEAVGEVEPGQLWVITGQAGVGKTTYLKQQMKEWALEGEPGLVWCGEMTQKQLVRQLIQSEYGVAKDEITVDHVAQCYRRFKDIPLYFGYHGTDPSSDLLVEMATQAFKRYGIRRIVIDNLALLTGGAKSTQDELLFQSRAVRSFKNFCIQFDANVFLVAHPRKSDDVNRIETAYDVSGSANIRNLADAGFTFFRRSLAPRNADDLYGHRGDLQDPKTAVIPLKTREAGGRTDAWLYLEGAYSRFREATEEDFQSNEEIVETWSQG